MLYADCLSINSLGHLAIDGCDTLMLAEHYGTPLYVMSETEIEKNVRLYQDSITDYYDGRGSVAYASKAFCCKEIYRIMKRLGASVDVASGGELHTALSVDFPPERIFFHGNNKTAPELARAVEVGVGRIVVDNLSELELLDSVARSAGKRVLIQIRIKPGIDPDTHDFVRTGQIDSKFGFALETGEAMDAVRWVMNSEGLELMGVHCHIGSQIFDINPFAHAAEVMVGFMAAVRKETGLALTELNLGGGFGIRYVESHNPAAYQSYMEAVSRSVKAACAQHELPLPFITLEPGRSIVGAAGITLYTAGAVKKIPGVRTYLTLDGGMADNPRYALYHAEYDACVAARAAEPRDTLVTLAGRCCESGDLIGEHMPIQPPQEGDIIAVTGTGAYNYSMASNYNRLPRPPVVMTREGSHRLIVRGESYDDLIAQDI
jgi:diaminopimelate decarboxylase